MAETQGWKNMKGIIFIILAFPICMIWINLALKEKQREYEKDREDSK